MLNQEQVDDLKSHANNLAYYGITLGLCISIILVALIGFFNNYPIIIVICLCVLILLTLLCIFAVHYSLHSLLKFFNNAKNNP